jgi:putative DeoR family transcriptional regulator (stage III sporulation protein D)
MIEVAGKERCEVLGDYVIETGATVRSCAAHFGISKSTVHKDLTVKLRYNNKSMYAAVNEILIKNKAERHIRGGEATRKKYLKRKLREPNILL